MSKNTVLSFNADQKAVLAKELREIMFGLNHVSQLIADDKLNPELGKNVLAIAEYGLAKVSKVTGIETNSAAEIEERHASIRAANQRIHELERQLGHQVAPEHIKQALTNYGRKLKHWWRTRGLGHVPDIAFSDYGNCQLTLSCNLFGNFSVLMSETPVSDKDRKAKWFESLRESGLVLKNDDHNELSVLDCESSRKALCDLILGTFPTARITDIHSYGDRNGSFKLRDIKVYIYSMDEIAQLPMPDDEND